MKSPISFAFMAANAAVMAKGYLYRFKPARTAPGPSWDGRGQAVDSHELTSPITDKSFWTDRYVLCELTLRKRDGTQLVINDAVCAVSREKNIVATRLVGRDGTVKEYIADGDYNVNIVVGVAAVSDGKIVDEYPVEGLKQLTEFFAEQQAVSVHSDFLDIFDISDIVIKSFSVTQDTASNYQSVSISAVSDEDYNIYSTEY